MALRVSDLPKPPDIRLKSANPSRSRRHYTVTEWLELPERPKTELVDGVLHKMPPPTQNHWRIITNIAFALDSHVLANKLGRIGGEVGVIIDGLSGRNGWLPDLAFASRSNSIQIGSKWVGVPDWVLEVWAANEQKPKRILDKRKLWQRAGVAEFWEIMLDKDQQLVSVYRLDEQGQYQLVPQEAETVCSEVIRGFCIERAAIFANLVEEK